MKASISIITFSLAILTACGGSERKAETVNAAAAAPVAVAVSAVSTVEWPEVYEAAGTVRARTAATIASKVMGYVQQVNAEVGSSVSAGQVLAVIDSRDLESNLRRAEAARSEVESAIPEADNGVAAAKANLDLAQATFKRMDSLAAQKSISSQEFDESTAKLKAAQAAYEMARSKRTQLNSKIAQVEQEIGSARIAAGYARITAPFAGVVTAKSIEPGNLASPGAPLFTIEQAGGYRLEAPVEESKIGSIRRGQAVQVALEALGRQVSARVSEIVPAVDAASRAYVVKIDLPAASELRSGMFGRALFPMGARKVLAAPAQAVVERGQLQSVFVVEDGAAHARLITVGQRSDGAVELLSGIKDGEQVASPVPPALRDGAKVEIRK
jgi:RND family efflux transporter MFP subunit